MGYKYKLGIMCVPRCASLWCAQSVQNSGVEFGHEKFEGAGGVGWLLMHYSPAGVECERLIHVIREPLAAISSIEAWFAWGSPCYHAADMYLHSGVMTHQAKLGRAMQMYHTYNALAHERAGGEIYRMENYPCGLVEDVLGQEIDWIPQPIHTKKHDRRSWADLRRQDERLADDIRRAWGYE